MADITLTGWRVLVVDDEPDSLEVASTLLEMCQAEVFTATNGREGFELAKLHRPHFIISDLSMPDMTGWEMLHELKNNIATRDLPVIALTAHAMDGDRSRALAAGFHNHLTKPLQPETFVGQLLKLVIDIPNIEQALPNIAQIKGEEKTHVQY